MSTIWRIKNIPNLLHLCAHFNSVSTRIVLIILALKLPPDIKWQTNRNFFLYNRMEKNLGLESIISTATLTNCFRHVSWGECEGKRRQQNPKIPLLHNWLQRFYNWGQQSTHARKRARRTGVFLRQIKTHESSQTSCPDCSKRKCGTYLQYKLRSFTELNLELTA